jgi:hypothetical protein
MAEFPPPSGVERLGSNLDPLNSIYTLYTGHKNLIILLILTLIPTLILTIHCFTTLALPLPLVILSLIRLIRNFNPAKSGKSIQINQSLFRRKFWKFFYLEWKHFL